MIVSRLKTLCSIKRDVFFDLKFRFVCVPSWCISTIIQGASIFTISGRVQHGHLLYGFLQRSSRLLPHICFEHGS